MSLLKAEAVGVSKPSVALQKNILPISDGLDRCDVLLMKCMMFISVFLTRHC